MDANPCSIQWASSCAPSLSQGTQPFPSLHSLWRWWDGDTEVNALCFTWTPAQATELFCLLLLLAPSCTAGQIRSKPSQDGLSGSPSLIQSHRNSSQHLSSLQSPLHQIHINIKWGTLEITSEISPKKNNEAIHLVGTIDLLTGKERLLFGVNL